MTTGGSETTGFLQLFLRGFRWTFLKSVSGLLVRVGTLVVLSRLLTPAEFGVVAVAISFIGSICLLVELGVGPALIQRQELTPRHVGSALVLSLGLAAIFMVMLQVIAEPVSHWLDIEDEIDAFRFLTIMLFLQPLITIFSSIARRNLDMRDVMASDLAGTTIGYSAIGIALAWLGFGYWALAIAQMSQFAITLILLIIHQRHRVTLRIGLREAGHVLAFGASFSIGRLANYAAQKFDRALIGMLLGVEAAGNYQRVLNLLQVVGPFFAGPLDAIMFPLLSRLQDDSSRLRRSYRAATAAAALITVPASVLICVSAPVLVPIVLGSQWSGVVLPVQIMAGVLFFRTNDSITDTLTRAVGKVRQRASLQVLYAAASLGSIFLLRDFGLPGIAAGLLCVTILNFIIMSFLVRRVTAMTLADNFTPLIPGFIIGACLAGMAVAFYLGLGNDLFTLRWMALYVGSSALAYVTLTLGLPALLFPAELANLRATLQQKLWRAVGVSRPATMPLNSADC